MARQLQPANSFEGLFLTSRLSRPVSYWVSFCTVIKIIFLILVIPVTDFWCKCSIEAFILGITYVILGTTSQT